MYPFLELLISTLELRRKSDAIVAFVHLSLLKNEFLCLGLGDVAGGDDSPSELMPRGWNDDPEMYTLRYINDRADTLICKIIPVDNRLLVNVTNLTKNQTAAISVLPDEFVDDFTSYKKAYKDLNKLNEQVQNKIILELFPRPKRSISVEKETTAKTTQEDDSNRSFQPIRIDPLSVDPIGVGRADLLPGDLGYGGGGMLMNPRNLLRPRFGHPMGPHGPALPRGAVPPGARFDPFGPPVPDLDRRGNPRFGAPNPDHLPPPGFDDMFG